MRYQWFCKIFFFFYLKGDFHVWADPQFMLCGLLPFDYKVFTDLHKNYTRMTTFGLRGTLVVFKYENSV
jgi:hypothetical protein